MKDMRDDRVHARMALVRDLFGLTVEDGCAPATSSDAAEPRRRPAERRRRPLRTSPRSASCPPARRRAAAGAADADRHAGQRARAGAGAVGGRAARRASVELVEITTLGDRGAPAATSHAGCPSSSARCSTGASTSPCTRPRTSPPSSPDGLELVAIPARADARDVICGAGALRGAGPRAPGSGTSSLRRAAQLRAAPRRPRGRRAARQRRHAAAQARRRRGRRARAGRAPGLRAARPRR